MKSTGLLWTSHLDIFTYTTTITAFSEHPSIVTMAFEQTVTIINNSGKIISTGKHLVGIFKEARSAYKEKKEALKQERAGNFRRAHTFHGPIVEEFDDGEYDQYGEDYNRNHRSLGYRHPGLIEDHRRQSLDEDRRSHVSTDSRRRPRLQRSSTASDAHSRSGRSERRPPRPPLTINNLRTLTEVSATLPSKPPQSFRANLQPYAETAPRDMMVSRVALDEAGPPPSAAALSRAPSAAAPRSSMMVHRPRSDPALRGSASVSSRPIDMHLAYGDIPPDLATRADLDTLALGECDLSADQQKAEAQTLVDRVETLLNEAHCIHHTAASIIRHLQDNPEAAAAVALTLAELSAILTKLSPAFLGVVKGGSPAVFALLASPQFLIGTSIAVGVTVVLFGGWKIVKKISEVSAARDTKQAIEMTEQVPAQPPTQQIPGARPNPALPANNRPPTLVSNGVDEALVLEEELSTIECWRRGIQPIGDNEAEPWEGTEVTEAEIELISPEAMRSRIALDDERTLRSVRTRRSTKSHSHYHSSSARESSSRKGKKPRDEESVIEVPVRRSSKDSHHDDTQSKSGDRHRSRSHSRSRSHRDRHDDTASEAGSVSTTRTYRSSQSRRHKEGRSGSSKAPGPSVTVTPPSEAGSSASKDKKLTSGGNGGNMLKQLFKKKKDAKDKGSAVSVMA